MIKSISLLVVLLGAVIASNLNQPDDALAIDQSKTCKLGVKRRIGNGTYYEECLPRFETSGCYANWIRKEALQYIPSGETVERNYVDRKIGFLYKCVKTKEYIYFAPVSCFITKPNGDKVTIPMNGKGTGNNGEDVYCKQNGDGEFSFEYGGK